MVLKGILNEILDERETQEMVAEISQLLKQYRNTNPILGRGESSSGIGVYSIRKIRKDRQPRDTTTLVDGVVEIYRQKEFPQRISRRRAKFAISFKDIEDMEMSRQALKDYGDPYVVFPERHAKINGYEFDTFSIFSSVRSKLDSASNLLTYPVDVDDEFIRDFVSDYLHYYRFLKHLSESDYDKTVKYFGRNFGNIVDEARAFIENEPEAVPMGFGDSEERKFYSLFRKGVKAFNKAMNYIHEYLSGLTTNIKSGYGEVLFTGDSYLAVHLDFFKEHFEYDSATNSYVAKTDLT